MTVDDEMSPGEVGRALQRIERNLDELRGEVRDRSHKAADDLTAFLAPLSALGIRMNVAEKNIEGLIEKGDSNRKTWDGAAAGFVGALVIVLIQYWLAHK